MTRSRPSLLKKPSAATFEPGLRARLAIINCARAVLTASCSSKVICLTHLQSITHWPLKYRSKRCLSDAQTLESASNVRTQLARDVCRKWANVQVCEFQSSSSDSVSHFSKKYHTHAKIAKWLLNDQVTRFSQAQAVLCVTSWVWHRATWRGYFSVVDQRVRRLVHQTLTSSQRRCTKALLQTAPR